MMVLNTLFLLFCFDNNTNIYRSSENDILAAESRETLTVQTHRKLVRVKEKDPSKVKKNYKIKRSDG